jgi:hypothetical protein
MERGRQAAEWGRASSLIAVMINTAAFRKGRAVKPSDFDPYAESQIAEAGTIKDLQRAFVAK